MNTWGMRPLTVSFLCFSFVFCGPPHPPDNESSLCGPVSPLWKETARQRMRDLRSCAWELFSTVVVAKQPAFQFPDWRQALDVFDDPDAADKKPNQVGRRPAHNDLTLFFAAEVPKSGKDEFITFESTFFNRAAYQHIRKKTYPLYRSGTTAKLQEKSLREVPEFPSDAVVVKTFWRLVPEPGNAKVGVWKWPKPPLVTDDAGQVFEDQWKNSVCVEVKLTPGLGCIKAEDNFYTTRTSESNQAGFACVQQQDCPELKPNQTLILIAMHIASKQMPDWLWTTFWWQGVDRQSGISQKTASWTCDNAQRPPVLTGIGVWSNYSMDVTNTFSLKKPEITDSTEIRTCGSPNPIGTKQHDELRAAYNPFIEGTRDKGRKSSCIDCHSRADTDRQPLDNRFHIPDVDSTDDYPGLSDFEGHIRTDYLWSLWNHLAKTDGPG